MYYDRQIKYFDYKKGGVRLRGAGFLKIEIRDENCNLSLQISGVQPADAYVGQMYGMWKNQEELLGNISLQGGRGNKELHFTRSSGMGSPAYEGLQAIRIPLKDGSELYCRIGTPEQTETKMMPQEAKEAFVEKTQEKRMQVNEAQSEKARPDIVREEHVYPDIVSEEEVQTKEMPQVEMQTEETWQVEVQSGEVQADEIPQEQEEAGERELLENIPSPSSRRMLEEKWEQLWGVYPHRCPFGDEREYLQIGPEDFVILRDRSYKLVHNSFLLHGFYNYQHLILTRLERRGESFYYVGVPGNFYDREKQVAVMYGFESFECLKEPAGPGDFGYYMIRVEL